MAKSILIVEDDRDQRDLLGHYLLGAGYVVRSVSNGLEAAASCLGTRPDLIISDVHMPHMSGFDMIRILKTEPKMKDIPVVFLTVDEGGRELGSYLGAVAYLGKPVKPNALLNIIEQLLSPAD